MTPEILQAGDTWTWTASVADYPSSTWTLKFALRGLGLSVIDITAAAGTGDDYAVTVEADVTAAFIAGNYSWTAWVEKGVGAARERYTVGQGSVKVLADMETATTGSDLRTHAQKVLDAIEAVLEGRATQAQASISIGGKSVSYMSPRDLLEWRSVYRREVAKEKAVALGSGGTTITRIQFGSE